MLRGKTITYRAWGSTEFERITRLLALGLALLATTASAQTSTTTFRDVTGRTTGTATTTTGGATVYRNSTGRSIGRAITTGTTTTFYDATGRVIGRETTTGSPAVPRR